MNYIEIETTIRGGLPVLVEGTVTRGKPPLPVPGEGMAVICPGWPTEAELHRIRFRSGHSFGLPTLTKADRIRIEDELIAAAKAQADE